MAEEASTLFLGGEPTIYFYKGEIRNEMLKLFFLHFPSFCAIPSKNSEESLEFRIKNMLRYIHLQQKLSRETLLIPILSLDSSSRRFWLAFESIHAK